MRCAEFSDSILRGIWNAELQEHAGSCAACAKEREEVAALDEKIRGALQGSRLKESQLPELFLKLPRTPLEAPPVRRVGSLLALAAAAVLLAPGLYIVWFVPPATRPTADPSPAAQDDSCDGFCHNPNVDGCGVKSFVPARCSECNIRESVECARAKLCGTCAADKGVCPFCQKRRARCNGECSVCPLKKHEMIEGRCTLCRAGATPCRAHYRLCEGCAEAERQCPFCLKLRDRAQASKEQREATEELVRMLGSEDGKARDESERRLVEMGLKILPLLEKHLSHDDPEIRDRIGRIRAEICRKFFEKHEWTDRVRRAHLIFVGRLLEVTDLPPAHPRTGTARLARMEIEHVLYGTRYRKTTEVAVREPGRKQGIVFANYYLGALEAMMGPAIDELPDLPLDALKGAIASVRTELGPDPAYEGHLQLVQDLDRSIKVYRADAGPETRNKLLNYSRLEPAIDPIHDALADRLLEAAAGDEAEARRGAELITRFLKEEGARRRLDEAAWLDKWTRRPSELIDLALLPGSARFCHSIPSWDYKPMVDPLLDRWFPQCKFFILSWNCCQDKPVPPRVVGVAKRPNALIVVRRPVSFDVPYGTELRDFLAPLKTHDDLIEAQAAIVGLLTGKIPDPHMVHPQLRMRFDENAKLKEVRLER
jgi:hypothetical protein